MGCKQGSASHLGDVAEAFVVEERVDVVVEDRGRQQLRRLLRRRRLLLVLLLLLRHLRVSKLKRRAVGRVSVETEAPTRE